MPHGEKSRRTSSFSAPCARAARLPSENTGVASMAARPMFNVRRFIKFSGCSGQGWDSDGGCRTQGLGGSKVWLAGAGIDNRQVMSAHEVGAQLVVPDILLDVRKGSQQGTAKAAATRLDVSDHVVSCNLQAHLAGQ